MSEQLPLNVYVELKPGCEDVYGSAVAGSRGWIRDRRNDRHGYIQVYIEWDKDSWRFNGEEDGWTFETHFKPVVKPNAPDLVDQEPLIPRSAPPAMEESCPDCGGVHDEDVDPQKRAELFIDTLNEALEDAVDGDAFMILTVCNEDGQLMPKVYGASLSDDATVILEAQLVSLAAQAHLNFSNAMIERLMRGDDDGPGR